MSSHLTNGRSCNRSREKEWEKCSGCITPMLPALHLRRSNSSLHCPLALPCKQGRFYLPHSRRGKTKNVSHRFDGFSENNQMLKQWARSRFRSGREITTLKAPATDWLL